MHIIKYSKIKYNPKFAIGIGILENIFMFLHLWSFQTFLNEKRRTT